MGAIVHTNVLSSRKHYVYYYVYYIYTHNRYIFVKSNVLAWIVFS